MVEKWMEYLGYHPGTTTVAITKSDVLVTLSGGNGVHGYRVIPMYSPVLIPALMQASLKPGATVGLIAIVDNQAVHSGFCDHELHVVYRAGEFVKGCKV